MLKKNIDPTGGVRLGVQKIPPGVGVWGKQPETGDLRFEIGKFFFVSTSHPTDPMGTGPVSGMNLYLHEFMVNFWMGFSCSG